MIKFKKISHKNRVKIINIHNKPASTIQMIIKPTNNNRMMSHHTRTRGIKNKIITKDKLLIILIINSKITNRITKNNIHITIIKDKDIHKIIEMSTNKVGEINKNMMIKGMFTSRSNIIRMRVILIMMINLECKGEEVMIEAIIEEENMTEAIIEEQGDMIKEQEAFLEMLNQIVNMIKDREL